MNLFFDLGNETKVSFNAEAKTINQPNNAPPVVLVFVNFTLANGQLQMVMPEPYAKALVTVLTAITNKNIMMVDAK